MTIDVTGAQDSQRQRPAGLHAEAEFSIDTLNPTVTAREVSDLKITDADTGAGTFQVTVTFNEAMDTAKAPTDADLRPGVAGTLTLTGGR